MCLKDSHMSQKNEFILDRKILIQYEKCLVYEK